MLQSLSLVCHTIYIATGVIIYNVYVLGNTFVKYGTLLNVSLFEATFSSVYFLSRFVSSANSSAAQYTCKRTTENVE